MGNVKDFDGAVISAGVEVPYRRHAEGVTTGGLLAQAVAKALAQLDLRPSDVDGLGVASFTLAPDHAIDLAWRLGISPRWTMDDCHGGASGINLLQHALRAVQGGDASVVVLVSGDHFGPGDFAKLAENYNATTRQHLRPLNFSGPNAVFAMLTARHMQQHGLSRSDYGAIAVTQRAWASENPDAVYRAPLTIDDYLGAPLVAEPLCRFDCVPVVSGANAIVVTASDDRRNPSATIRVRALEARHNPDHQQADGLATGLARLAGRLWSTAGLAPDEVDVVSVYDDYPAMVLIQLADLGFAPSGEVRGLIERIAARQLAVNTSGGQLSAGQAGAAGGMHGLVEAIRQLRGEAAGRQIEGARTAVVSGYGMVEYRYGMCANAVVMERI
ncbi:thiolase family protein [Trinickia violacea]|uniref:Thiolase family protein n=1 Tax=Trinickia violacea TaxID=2571746 RepID=A0A4P8IVF4_9BURK|nr:thiolase family protein [Trinickia violacea]QCP49849.1 thiolase family protein [Trinickia violacea]